MLSIAPMIDWTYVHFRVLMRMLAPNAVLYTEMQTTGAVVHNPSQALEYHAIEKPLILQLGGNDKAALVQCAKQAEEHGFSEINLNLGCPSATVQAGQFGACLMAKPKHVAECISAMKQAVSIPVTAKTRIGIDEQDSYAFFSHFARTLIEAGADKLIVHARKAWLKGVSPKQNRTLPPVHYDYVYRIKEEFPNTPIIINGNIKTIEEIKTHLNYVDGVMLGRLACENPYEIAIIHHALYPESPLLSRAETLTRYIHYALSVPLQNKKIGPFIKPILNLTLALPGARAWRERLTKIQQTGTLHDVLDMISLLVI